MQTGKLSLIVAVVRSISNAARRAYLPSILKVSAIEKHIFWKCISFIKEVYVLSVEVK
jgi:hypothetical protein